MWSIQFTAKDRKEAQTKLAEHPHVKVLPTALVAVAKAGIEACPKPDRGQVIFFQTHGHCSDPSACDWHGATMNVSLITVPQEEAP